MSDDLIEEPVSDADFLARVERADASRRFLRRMRKLGIAAGVLGGVFGGLTGYGISAAWSTLCNVPVMKPAIFVAAAGAFGPYLIIMGIALSLTPAELIESAEAVEFRELLRIKTATAFRLRFVYLLLGILACCYVVLWAAVPLEPSGCAGRY